MRKSVVVSLLLVVLLFSTIGFAFAEVPAGTSAHEVLYTNEIRPISGSTDTILIDASLDVTGTITGLLTPGGQNDKKVFLGESTNVLFNSGLRDDVDLTVTNCVMDNKEPSDEYMNFLFDGRIDPDPSGYAVTCSPSENNPVEFTIDFSKQYIDGDVVVGWVADTFHPVDFQILIYVYGEHCTPGNGFCDPECEKLDNCDYSNPPQNANDDGVGGVCVPGEPCGDDELGWVTLFDYRKDSNLINKLDSETSQGGKSTGGENVNSQGMNQNSVEPYAKSSFAMLFNEEIMKAKIEESVDLMGEVNLKQYGNNLKIGAIKLIVTKFNGNNEVFELSEFFFLDGLSEAYPHFYANVRGDTFYGDVKVQADVEVTGDLSANSADLGLASIDGDLTVSGGAAIRGDVNSQGKICDNDACLEPSIWKKNMLDPSLIYYPSGYVGIMKSHPTSALDILGSLRITDTFNRGGTISATNGNVEIEAQGDGDIIIRLG
jgi:hypothetical protein